jgi:hypothetical protein
MAENGLCGNAGLGSLEYVSRTRTNALSAGRREVTVQTSSSVLLGTVKMTSAGCGQNRQLRR